MLLLIPVNSLDCSFLLFSTILPFNRSSFIRLASSLSSFARYCHSSSTMMTSPPTHLFHPLPNPSPQNDNGLAISQLFKQGGPGTTVFLVPRTTYPLYSAIDFSHHSTNLATQGFPTFDSGNQAILETRGEKEAGAVKMFNLPRTTLKRVHLRGCRGWGATPPKEEEEKERLKKEGKLGWLEGGGALVWMGGPEAYESCVEGCRIEDPRGWTGVSREFERIFRFRD